MKINENTRVTLTIGQIKKIVLESMEDVFAKSFSKFIEGEARKYKEEIERLLSAHSFSDVSFSYNDGKGIIINAKYADGDITIRSLLTSSTLFTKYGDGSKDDGQKLSDLFGKKDFDELQSLVGIISMKWKYKLDAWLDDERDFMYRHSNIDGGRQYIDKYDGKWPKRPVY